MTMTKTDKVKAKVARLLASKTIATAVALGTTLLVVALDGPKKPPDLGE